jgi:Domain of unknown function (DUF4129)
VIPLRLADVPVVIDRDDARQAAEAELARSEYQAAQPDLVERALRWLGQGLADLFESAAQIAPGGALGVLVLLAVAVLIVVVIRLRVGKFAREVSRPGEVFEDHSRAARDYRQAAEQAFAAADMATAVRERFRAIVRGMEERGVLEQLSGRTADEAARDAGLRLPSAREELIAAAQLFDGVHYGGQPAAAEDYRRLVALDEATQRERVLT